LLQNTIITTITTVTTIIITITPKTCYGPRTSPAPEAGPFSMVAGSMKAWKGSTHDRP
jgi:hypothetical protein